MISPFYNAIKTCYLSGYWDGKEEILSMAVDQGKITEDEMNEIKKLRQIELKKEEALFEQSDF
ncbi:hypothetical protein KIV12_13075 [Bacillus altitudinis]|uniref:hypothetical protein n=1 Tax=Bacillus altitudinis TaxID=293387 RepID=UPI001C3EAF46|nr:hypothetical protein [Bacillus altitudinis]QXJ47114.1 hypothetical protein KIV12_13075 [Bacillus altitudinis]